MPRRVDHEERRRQIADALVRTAATRGLHATGMREVAAEAGVSLRLVQYYFGTKEELLLAAMQQLAAQFSDRAMARIRHSRQGDGPASPRDVIAAIENAPADLDFPHSTGLRVLFNQLLVVNDEERQVENPIAPREANLRSFRSGISRNARQSENTERNQARQAWRHHRANTPSSLECFKRKWNEYKGELGCD